MITANNNTGIFAGLDIGTTKITTVIGEFSYEGILDILGEATVPSDGIKRGSVVNLERTTQSIRQCIASAERVAGVKVKDVYVAVNGTHIKAMTSHGLAAIRRNQEITVADVERAIENARAVPLDPSAEILHVLPQEYTVDGQTEIKNPVGMQGVRLEVDVHIVAGSAGPLANLRRCIQDAGVKVNQLVLQSYASGLAVLDQSDREHAVILIDIGGGSTDIAVFKRGNLSFSSTIPIGGDHITTDIAQILKIPTDEAERIKKKYGSALPELADSDLSLEITQSGTLSSITAHELSRVIKPRVAEILALVRGELDQSIGTLEVSASSVILTGGTSQMLGMKELLKEKWRLPTRIGVPRGLEGLVDMVETPTHTAAVGLLRFAVQDDGLPAPVKAAPAFIPYEEYPEPQQPEITNNITNTPETPTEQPKSLIAKLKEMFKDFF